MEENGVREQERKKTRKERREAHVEKCRGDTDAFLKGRSAHENSVGSALSQLPLTQDKSQVPGLAQKVLCGWSLPRPTLELCILPTRLQPFIVLGFSAIAPAVQRDRPLLRIPKISSAVTCWGGLCKGSPNGGLQRNTYLFRNMIL